MFSLRNFCTCNPFHSRSSIIQKVIDLDPCKTVIDTEFSIDFCPRCNRKKQEYPCYPSETGSIPFQIEQKSENHSLSSETCITIPTCTPSVNETICTNVKNGLLLHVRLNLLHVYVNRKLDVGALICSNDVPYAFKMQCIQLKPTYCICKKHRRYNRCACTTADFEFLISDDITQKQLSLMIITQYRW